MLKSTLLSFTCYLLITPQSFFAQCTNAGIDLVAPYASDNSNEGVMFDISATNTVTIYCFDVNLPASSTGDYEIYYKIGSYVGSENTAGNWTLVGSANAVSSNGTNISTSLPIPVNLLIASGDVFAFYITASAPIGTNSVLTTSNAGYSTIASDENMEIMGGIGISYPFDVISSDRSFNGTVHYTTGDALTATLLDFNAVKVNESVLLEWQTESEYNSDYFEVERSSEGTDWNRLFTVKAAGESNEPLIYQKMDENPIEGLSYYRLNQYDFDGTKTLLKTVSFNNKIEIGENDIWFFPNPVNDRFRVFGDKSELEDLQIFNSIGENISGNLTMNAQDGFTEIVFKDQIEGLLILKSKTNSQILVKK